MTAARVEAVALEDWRWYGMPAHFIGGASCVFHLATEIGPYMISTVGDYRPNRDKPMQQIGCDRFFETYVFRTNGRRCALPDCGCSLPEIDPCEIESLSANDAGTAQDNHMVLCRKYADAANIARWESEKGEGE